MGNVSYSKYSVWSTCPYQFKLNYVDKLGTSRGNIHTMFGTAMHETIQGYLDVFYNVSKKQADKIDLVNVFYKKFVQEFENLHKDASNDEFFCTTDEMVEFYKDGLAILDWFKKPKNQRKFFSKRGYELKGIEVPINMKLRNNVNAVGFIDIVLYNTTTGRYTIIDLKTSTRGWNDYKKNDDNTKNQIILYKKWYSEQYGVPIDKIDVEFHIMRRKMPERELEFVVPRISRFVPANKTPSINKAIRAFDHFIDEVFNEDGTYKDKEYMKLTGRHCEWCEFFNVHCDGKE